MLGIVLAMAMFFSQIEYRDDFVCVPEAVFSPEFFLSTNNEDIPLDDILEKLDTVWAETERLYQKCKYDPNISNLEYCVLFALKSYSDYRKWYLVGKPERLEPLTINHSVFYDDITNYLFFIDEPVFYSKKHIQEYLDNFF